MHSLVEHENCFYNLGAILLMTKQPDLGLETVFYSPYASF